MKHSRISRYLCMVICAVMVLGSFLHSLPLKVSAASTTYKLAELLEEDKIKPLGRTTVHEVSGTQYLATDWSGTGFEISLTHSEDQTLVLGYRASYSSYWAIHLDGEQIYRGSHGASSNGSIYITVPSGTHTVSFIKESALSDSETAYWDLSTLRLSGTVNAAPANKDLYIEFIGDSYSCGSGALGQYIAGKAWSGEDHSATNGFPWYTAQNLNADYSIVARGGIGLFVGISEQEGTAQKKGIQDVYTYASGFRTGLGQYDFARQPDVVVVELGANDTIDADDQYKTIEYWTGLLEAFTDTVREKNPNAHIVYLSHNMEKHLAMRGIVEAREESDPKLYALYYPHSGNGSAAVDNQAAGHPSYSDHQELAQGLSNFISTSVLSETVAQDPAYSDVTYYVSENGSDSNDGLTIATAKKTVKAAYTAATAATLPAGSRLVLYLQGTVPYSDANAQALFDTTQKTADGKKLPILVTTYNYSGEKAILDTAHTAVNDGNASQCIYNDVTFRNVAIQGTTRVATTSDGKLYRDRNLYCGYNNVVFDNTSFLHAVDSAVPEDATLATGAWRISGGFFGSRVPSESKGETSSTVTFCNGDYTGLDFAAAVMQSSVGSSNAGTLVSEVMHCTHKLVIGPGAHMSTVYNRYGKLGVQSSTVEIQGGTVDQYLGTYNGTNTTTRFSTKGDVCFVMRSGTVKGERFITAGNYVTLDGDLINDISGGTIHIIPKGINSQYYGFMFAGSHDVTVNNVTNNISGGRFLLESDNTYLKSGVTTNVDAGFYFGGSSAASVQNATNNISGGVFMFLQGEVASGHSGFYFGQHSGKIHGTLTNNISGGIFDNTNAGVSGSIYFGPRATSTAINKIVNVIGLQGTTKGPRFHISDSILLGAGWAQVGITGDTAGSPRLSPRSRGFPGCGGAAKHHLRRLFRCEDHLLHQRRHQFKLVGHLLLLCQGQRPYGCLRRNIPQRFYRHRQFSHLWPCDHQPPRRHLLQYLRCQSQQDL